MELGRLAHFSDLTKACPKDCFPLPKIDLMVDATSRYELLYFMDAYTGYNQISMPAATEESASVSVLDTQGTTRFYGCGQPDMNSCTSLMPFRLKKAGATYQRLVNCMFMN
ncbi:uncharacterized protein LOC133818380 [Humulus lupulus]|uniref:uncharacterized protein LOC133818380 n=1 Tax=Humulus lupulus TaxID=3486 RepID=UPI002B40B935|nr:uncharacterized protein LOC133818380 [Humulus lupulus]